MRKCRLLRFYIVVQRQLKKVGSGGCGKPEPAFGVLCEEVS